MNACLHLVGSERLIMLSMRDWRRAGIAFITTEMRPSKTHTGKRFVSSREILHSWERSCTILPADENTDFYAFFRERDIEMAIMAARVRVKIVDRAQKKAETGV